MSHDRITQLRIRGMRAIEDVTLDLEGLTVLIGDNGSGKSTVLEALELLRQAAKPIDYVSDIVVRAHGGLPSLLRRGARELKLGVTVEGAGPKLVYDFAIANIGNAPEVVSEHVTVSVHPVAIPALARLGKKGRIFVPDEETPEETFHTQRLAAAGFGFMGKWLFPRLTKALAQIEQHVSFETRPLWQQRELDLRIGPRWPAMVEQTGSLARYGLNLPNCYQQLRNLGDEVWTRVLARARMGLGDDFRSFRLAPSGRGNIELEVVFGSMPDKPLPAEYLSEGQLSYLAFIALVELNQERSLLAFDEPELHLHPALLARVVWMFEEVAKTSPVIVATHSDRFLDALADPASSVVLCELDDQRAMQPRWPNAARLAEWLESYRGLGAIRSEGYEAHVFDNESSDETPTEGG
ncbi:MAG TPA: AAA family ATPase [Haliangium sp.]|nr:AAA family ATPase [Haliangium sp.]